MARHPRLILPDQPLHIMHRGNNRQNIFENEDDMARILSDIKESLGKANYHLHAYVIITNHLHLLVTPKDKDELLCLESIGAERLIFNKGLEIKKSRRLILWFYVCGKGGVIS